MAVLRFFEGIRTPFFDTFFSLITKLGEETIFIVVGLIFYWCVSKKQGYYLLSIGLIGTVLNQFLKLIFRIPRPWIKDNNFTIVESAREQATGYSFPSGHTQSAVGIFGGIARWNKNKILRIICIVLCVLVPISRMYLGVHTLADTAISTLLALVFIFALYPVIHNATNKGKTMRILLCGMTLFATAFLLFTLFFKFPINVDINNLAHGTETACKMLGCIVGLWLAFEIDTKYIRFDTKAVWWIQILKLILGLIPLILIKSLLKQPLISLLGNELLADGVRYFLIAVFAGCIWPMTFKLFNKFSKKDRA